MKKILIDKDFLLAIIDKSNSNHNLAIKITKKIQNSTIFINSIDYFNFVTTIQSQYDEKTTYKIMKKILNQKIFFLFPGEEIIKKANNYLINNQTNHNYIECVNKILFEKNQINYIASFSSNYQDKLLPLI